MRAQCGARGGHGWWYRGRGASGPDQPASAVRAAVRGGGPPAGWESAVAPGIRQRGGGCAHGLGMLRLLVPERGDSETPGEQPLEALVAAQEREGRELLLTLRANQQLGTYVSGLPG